jgi:hypothetical protein
VWLGEMLQAWMQTPLPPPPFLCPQRTVASEAPRLAHCIFSSCCCGSGRCSGSWAAPCPHGGRWVQAPSPCQRTPLPSHPTPWWTHTCGFPLGCDRGSVGLELPRACPNSLWVLENGTGLPRGCRRDKHIQLLHQFPRPDSGWCCDANHALFLLRRDRWIKHSAAVRPGLLVFHSQDERHCAVPSAGNQLLHLRMGQRHFLRSQLLGCSGTGALRHPSACAGCDVLCCRHDLYFRVHVAVVASAFFPFFFFFCVAVQQTTAMSIVANWTRTSSTGNSIDFITSTRGLRARTITLYAGRSKCVAMRKYIAFHTVGNLVSCWLSCWSVNLFHPPPQPGFWLHARCRFMSRYVENTCAWRQSLLSLWFSGVS